MKQRNSYLKFLMGCLFLLCGFLSVDAQTTIQVGTGTGTSNIVPIKAYYGYTYSQQIYTAAEITAAGGFPGALITKIRFAQNSGGTPTNSNGWTVYMANSSRTTYSSGSDWEPIGNFTQVFSGNITYNGTANGWVEITLSTPFVWNGTSNIIIGVDENTAGYAASEFNWNVTSATNRAIYYYDDTNNPNPASPPTGTVSSSIPNVQLVLAPLCTSAPTPGNTLASPASVCSGGSSSFSLQNPVTASGITFQWQYFDGTSWVNISGATASTYTRTNITATTDFRCAVTCNGTDVGYSTPVTVVANALPTVSVSPVSSVTCASEAVALTASGADTYTWTPNTNLSATTGATVNSTAAAVLTYTVTGTVTATGCQNIATATVTPITAFPITVASTPAVACTNGTPITLNGVSPVNISGGGQVEYQWLDSAGTTVLQDWSTTGYTFTPANIGTYRFNVKARVSTCPSNVSPTWPYSISVGFNGNVNVSDVYCGQTAGSISITNALGPLTSGTWYENTFSTANLNPTQIQLFGNSAVISNGKLVLTPNVTSRNGGAVIYNPSGINPKSMELRFDLTVGGGPTNTNGADGMSWSFGPDVVGVPTGTGNGVTTLNAETGSGTGLKIGFDAYGGSFPNQAGIYLMYNCTTYDMQLNSPGLIQYLNNLTWKGTTQNIIITIDDLGRLTMKFGTTVIFNNIQLPAAYVNADKSTWKHAFSARTGGVSMNHEIDNIKITYTKTDVVYGIAPTGSGLPATWQANSNFTNVAIGSYDVYVGSGANPAGCNKFLGTFELNDSTTPAPGNTYSSLPSVCSNTNTAVTLSLQDAYAAYAGITYQWQSFDGTNWVDIQNATNATYTFNGLPQTTDFRAKVSCDTNQTGISNTVTVLSVTPPTINVTPAAVTLCTGELPTLTASGADTYTWSPNTGLSASTGSSVQASPTGYQQYTITGTVTSTGCSNTTTAYVTPIEFLPVTAAPTAQICTAGTPVTLDVTSVPDYVAGSGTLEYQWLDSTNAIVQDWSAASSYTFTPTTEGYYYYFVNVRSTGCASVPPTQRVEFFVGFGGQVSTIDINCYVPTGTISIYNYFGQGTAGTWFSNNFNTTLNSSQATLQQNASLTGGRAVLTPSATGNKGGLTILNPSNIQGTNVQYDITFKMTADQPINVYGTGGADGIAYSFGPDANYSTTTGNPCAGFGSKLRISFDAAGNQDAANNFNVEGIYVSYGYGGTGQIGPNLATTLAFVGNTTSWKLKTDVPVSIKITTDGKLTLTVDGAVIFANVQLPAEFVTADKTSWKHLFSAQTGGDAMRQAIDDLNIKYSALNFGVTTSPTNLPTTWQQSPVFTGLTAGDYNVYVSSVANPTCSKLLGTFPIIDRNPHVNWPLDTVLCAGQTLVLDAGNQGSFYQWNTGESGIDEQFYTVSTPGTYVVNVEDTIGCTTVGYISVTGSPLPVVSLGADTSICSGTSLTLDAGAGGTYLWNNSTTNQTLSVNASGTYSVTVTNSNGCSASDAIAVTVLNPPTVASVGTTINGQSVAFVAQTPQNVTTYTWAFGDGNTITTVSPNINYNYAHCGTYNVTLTVNNNANCGTASATTSVTFVCAGIEEVDANKGLHIYPNPARDFIAIANPDGLSIEKLTVYDASGKEMFKSTNVSNLVPDITNWAPGMYLVKIDADNKTFVQRIIIGK